jgi:sugar lactone lactonase YvrE
MIVHDATPCELGEGPLWHPERAELFWFDILAGRLHAKGRHWDFGECASAAGWIDRDTLLIATETGLARLRLDTGARERVVAIEADRPGTRSNDGRADPMGGFWIGTMGKKAEKGAGAIWRYWRGELRRIVDGLAIPNAICFAPGGRVAHFADTPTGRVMRVALDDDGWPAGDPEIYLDLSAEGLRPDGAVVAADGTFWVAQWGAGRVAAYDPSGRFVEAVAFAAPQTSCPAFGGPGLRTLFCTTAREGMDAAALARHPLSGQTFASEGHGPGQPEHRVLL